MNLKVEDVLIAKDVCLMDTGEEALTIGKEYSIIDVYSNDTSFAGINGIVIMNDDCNNHLFDFDSIDEFFNVKK